MASHERVCLKANMHPSKVVTGINYLMAAGIRPGFLLNSRLLSHTRFFTTAGRSRTFSARNQSGVDSFRAGYLNEKPARESAEGFSGPQSTVPWKYFLRSTTRQQWKVFRDLRVTTIARVQSVKAVCWFTPGRVKMLVPSLLMVSQAFFSRL